MVTIDPRDTLRILRAKVRTGFAELYAAVGGIITDHGGLTGLGDDDHTQYHNDARGDARYSLLAHDHDADYAAIVHSHATSDITDFDLTVADDVTQVFIAGSHTGIGFTYNSLGGLPWWSIDAAVVYAGSGAANSAARSDHDHSGVYADTAHNHDHGTLTGLGDDDHPQYPLAAGTETIAGAWTFTAQLLFDYSATAAGAYVEVNSQSPYNSGFEAQVAGAHRMRVYWNTLNSRVECVGYDGAGVGEYAWRYTYGGALQGYYANTVKVATDNYGITVTGVMTDGLQDRTIVDNDAFTLSDGVATFINIATGTKNNVDITMPPNPKDGQHISIISAGAITDLQILPNTGQTVRAGATSCDADAHMRWRYRAADLTWYREYVPATSGGSGLTHPQVLARGLGA